MKTPSCALPNALETEVDYSALMFAAFTKGHHFQNLGLLKVSQACRTLFFERRGGHDVRCGLQHQLVG